jgi:antitoxin PrlF
VAQERRLVRQVQPRHYPWRRFTPQPGPNLFSRDARHHLWGRRGPCIARSMRATGIRVRFAASACRASGPALARAAVNKQYATEAEVCRGRSGLCCSGTTERSIRARSASAMSPLRQRRADCCFASWRIRGRSFVGRPEPHVGASVSWMRKPGTCGPDSCSYGYRELAAAALYSGGMTGRVGAKGQVVIPKSIRDQAQLHPGDEVEFEFEDDQIIMVARRRAGSLGGRFSSSGMAARLLEDRAREPR